MAKGRLDILVLKPGKKGGEDKESPKDAACKALWEAIQEDDYEGFKTALDDYLTYREDEKSEPESDDESSDY